MQLPKTYEVPDKNSSGRLKTKNFNNNNNNNNNSGGVAVPLSILGFLKIIINFFLYYNVCVVFN
jgi:hypothetical protein